MEQIGPFAKSEVLVQIGIVSSLLIPADAIYRKIVSTASWPPRRFQ